MKTISFNIDEKVYEESEKIFSTLSLSKNKYMNEALIHYNKIKNIKILEKKIKSESKRVSKNSLEVLKEFEAIEFKD